MNKKKTTEEFIKNAKEIHGEKYDYSKTNYKSTNEKVCITCKKHGDFWQTPNSHLSGGSGCPKCYNDSRKLTTEEFIKKAKEVHGDKYDYSKVNYTNNHTSVTIICPEHGEFSQIPSSHLSGYGCRKCAIERIASNNSLSTDVFIDKLKSVIKNSDNYDFSKTIYRKAKHSVNIICKQHGEFSIIADNSLRRKAEISEGHICPKCISLIKGEYFRSNTEDFIKKAKEIHGDKYDYSKVNYKKAAEKVSIICPRHGEFLQSPNKHLSGRGCPLCRSSRLENTVRNFLQTEGIEFEEQKSWDWLKFKKIQRVDFYLTKFNCIIECQGEQHFIKKLNSKFKNSLNEIQDRDKNKRKLCEEHGIKVFYYSNLKIKYPYQVYEDLEVLINEIKKIDLTNQSSD